MKIENGAVIPGKSIGNFKLNITKRELLRMIGKDYKIRIIDSETQIITIDNAMFWIAKDRRVDQIGVGKGFKGKFKDVIGIGSTLADVKKYIGNYIDVYCTYELENDKGICFELEDVDDWEELTAPIEYIFVFRTDK